MSATVPGREVGSERGLRLCACWRGDRLALGLGTHGPHRAPRTSSPNPCLPDAPALHMLRVRAFPVGVGCVGAVCAGQSVRPSAIVGRDCCPWKRDDDAPGTPDRHSHPRGPTAPRTATPARWPTGRRPCQRLRGTVAEVRGARGDARVARMCNTKDAKQTVPASQNMRESRRIMKNAAACFAPVHNDSVSGAPATTLGPLRSH